MPAPATAKSLLSGYPPNVGSIAAAARRLVRGVLPKAEEVVDGSAKLLGYRYGPGYKGLVCTLILSKSEVKLGIVRGAELADPDGLMTGAGKVHRHVRLRNLSDVSRPEVKALLERALEAWRARNGELGDRAPTRSDQLNASGARVRRETRARSRNKTRAAGPRKSGRSRTPSQRR